MEKSALHFFFLTMVCIWLCCLVERSKPISDHEEARTIKSLLDHWGLTKRLPPNPNWNLSDDICNGWAIVGESVPLEDINFNPSIKCKKIGDIFHVIQFRAFNLNATGTLPDYIGNLSKLEFLKLDQNFLNGTLPASLGNLRNLSLLSLAMNNFTGEIPKELGKLKQMRVLSLGLNKFSGSLLPQIGDMLLLEELYVPSSGLSGRIPLTFANLTNLKVFHATDNNFTEAIPDFIGDLIALTDLRFQGNAFTGPIPATFSKLTNISSLYISDLTGPPSSLGFIRNMKNISTLILRNCMISDVIPKDLGQNLKMMDLSFNNISGNLPDSLFNLESLICLFLGNNSLSGELPASKSSLLLYIDLSYNQLEGRFPSWLNQSNLQLNIVANKFQIDGSSSHPDKRLKCLQQGFSCKRSRSTSFAINCGGDEVSFRNFVFQADNENTGHPVYYYVSDKKDWALSSVGFFSDDGYIVNSKKNMSNWSQLYNTARASPGSLRFYGLGLENGNYTVHLLFAEIEYVDNFTWLSNGERLFHIYIQGELRIKDFNIRKEAGGLFKPVEKELNTTVTKNFLEIHLFWAGKGTQKVPSDGRRGPLISAIKVEPNFKVSKNKNVGLIAGVISAVAIAFFCILIFVLFTWKRKKLRAIEDQEFLDITGKPRIFTCAELHSATDGFSLKNKLGEGGFGSVYKGKLSNGRFVAVKQLAVSSHQGKNQFIAEVEAISAIQHRNLVKFYGYCNEGSKPFLVYEYLENRSLDLALFCKGNLNLDWSTRYRICLGTAGLLAYLHEESNPRIIHRDIKASNILLDAELNPKISDFGLAKLFDDKKTHISTNVIAGTRGYLAPEYALRGQLSEKVDVFSFGVVCLEVISGRPHVDITLDQEKMFLLDWAWRLHENVNDLELLDPRLLDFDEEQARRLIRVALCCLQASPSQRPSMSQVVDMMVGNINVSIMISKPGYLKDLQMNEMSNIWREDGTENNTSNYKMSWTSSTIGEGGSSYNRPNTPLLHHMEEGR